MQSCMDEDAEGRLGMTDIRFDRPLYGASEAAAYVGVTTPTIRRWSDVITQIDANAAGKTIPFAGLAEATVVRELRDAGLSLRAIREANERLKESLRMSHPLIYRNLAHDGREILCRIDGSWERARDRNLGIPDIIEVGLQRVSLWGDDDLPARLRIDWYGCEVIIDPRLSGGHPLHWQSGARVEDILGLVRAGDSVDVAAEEFGLSPEEVQTLVLADYRRVA